MTPSELAKESQHKSDQYPGVDNWQDTQLHKGNIIYVWETNDQMHHGNGDVYAMTPDTALECHGDPNKLQNDLQTALNPHFDTHREKLQAYEIKGDVPAAFSHVEANQCHGTGGGEQYFVPSFDSECENGNIVKRDELNLYFNKEMLSINQEQKFADQEALEAQPPELLPIPSKGTTATLEGSYQGPTINLAEELKPQIDAAQNEWSATKPSESTTYATQFNPTDYIPQKTTSASADIGIGNGIE